MARWSVEMQAPGSLMDEGWSRSLLAPGDSITVFAHPLRDDDGAGAVRRVLYLGTVLADGRTLGRVPAGTRGGE
ncbi:MAG: DUF6152 family protein [Pseudomonadota bacterium]|jgi:hypothetical protein